MAKKVKPPEQIPSGAIRLNPYRDLYFRGSFRDLSPKQKAVMGAVLRIWVDYLLSDPTYSEPIETDNQSFETERLESVNEKVIDPPGFPEEKRKPRRKQKRHPIEESLEQISDDLLLAEVKRRGLIPK